MENLTKAQNRVAKKIFYPCFRLLQVRSVLSITIAYASSLLNNRSYTIINNFITKLTKRNDEVISSIPAQPDNILPRVFTDLISNLISHTQLLQEPRCRGSLSSGSQILVLMHTLSRRVIWCVVILSLM